MKKIISGILVCTILTGSTTVVTTFADNSGTPKLTTISEETPKVPAKVKPYSTVPKIIDNSNNNEGNKDSSRNETKKIDKKSFWQKSKDTIKKAGIALAITGAGAFIISSNYKASAETQPTTKKSFWQRNKDTIKKAGIALAIIGTKTFIDDNKAFTEAQQTTKTFWQKSKNLILTAGAAALLTGAGIVVGSIAFAGASAGAVGVGTVLSTVGTTIALVGSASIVTAFLVDNTVNRYISKY